MQDLATLKSLIRYVPPHRVVPGNRSHRPPSALCLMGRPPLRSVTSRYAGLPTPPEQPSIGQEPQEEGPADGTMPAQPDSGGAM